MKPTISKLFSPILDHFWDFLNQRRLRDYPLLFLLAYGLVVSLNLLLRRGWIGGLGQIIGIDYLLFYSTGLIYRQNPSNIYNFEAHNIVQRNLISPTELPAVNPYFNPPYVALPHSWLTYLSYPTSLLIWSVLSISFVIITGKILYPSIHQAVKEYDFSSTRFLIVVFSFFPFIEGFLEGQNHTITLLLVSSIILFSLSEHWYLAGFAAGLLIYKPQFVLGFLIIWLFARKLKSLLSFTIVAVIWIGTFLLINGGSLFRDYFVISSILLKLPYDPGFPAYLLTTPYGLFTSILPESLWYIAYGLCQLILVGFSVLIAWQTFQDNKNKQGKDIYLYSMAILFPLIATPYALLHDMVILIPLFVIISKIHPSKSLMMIVIGTYIGGLILPLAGHMTNLTLTPLIPIFLTIYLLKNLLSKSTYNQVK